MKRGALIAAALAALAVAAPTAASAKDPLVYVIVIDGLDGDSVEAGAAPFLRSLLAGRGGRTTYYPGSRSVLPAETNPNHTAMMTGAYPGRSGIAANAFAIYAPLAGEDSCRRAGPLDLTALPSPTTGESPTCPKAETVFESVRRQAGPRRPVTAAIMGKPKLGRIFDVSYRGRRAADYLWAPCTGDTAADDDYCDPHVPTNPISGYANEDALVMDEVVRTAVEGVRSRGRMRRPNFTFVNLPQVDTAGHALGRSPVYDGSVRLADAQIERLADVLKAGGEWRRTVLIVTSDHSMDTTIWKLSLTSALTGADVPEQDFLVVANGSVDFIYHADRRAPRRQRDRLLSRMRAVVLRQEGVAEALYRRPNGIDGGRRHTIARVHPRWTAGRRTGDLFVTAKQGWAFSDPGGFDNPLIGNHGAPHTADNFMAVTGGWPKIRQRSVRGAGRRAHPSNADVAATVMRLFGLRAPSDNAGRALWGAFKQGALRRR